MFDSFDSHEASLCFLKQSANLQHNKNHQCQYSATLTNLTYQIFLFHSISILTKFKYEVMKYLQFSLTSELQCTRIARVQKKK